MPVAAHEFFRRVQAVAEGTPYVVTETDRGFDVTLDIVDAQWFGLYSAAGLSKVFVHHVSVPEAGHYSITDESREVSWDAGVLRVSARASRVSGRVIELGAQKVWAFDAQGRFGVQADYRFGSEEGRDLVVGVADELHLTGHRGTAEKLGLFFGILGAVGGLVTVVAVLVVWLTGGFQGV